MKRKIIQQEGQETPTFRHAPRSERPPAMPESLKSGVRFRGIFCRLARCATLQVGGHAPRSERPPAMPESLKSGVARQVGAPSPNHPRGLFVGSRLVLRAGNPHAVIAGSKPVKHSYRLMNLQQPLYGGGWLRQSYGQPRLFVGSRLVLRA